MDVIEHDEAGIQAAPIALEAGPGVLHRVHRVEKHHVDGRLETFRDPCDDGGCGAVGQDSPGFRVGVKAARACCPARPTAASPGRSGGGSADRSRTARIDPPYLVPTSSTCDIRWVR